MTFSRILLPVSEPEFSADNKLPVLKPPTLKIIVATHRQAYLPSDAFMLPLHCGKAKSNLQLGYAGDDTGENISEKNASFCELTAIYWAWKNLKETDYIGFCHYRRYFYPAGTRIAHNFTPAAFRNLNLNTAVLLDYLTQKDIILSRKRLFWKSNWNLYGEMHYIKDLKLIETVIEEMHPEYLPSFVKLLRKSNALSQQNMFIMKWSDFDAYCHWLFSILFEAERRTDISGYDVVQRRVWGYIAERLLGVFVHHRKLSPKYVSTLFVNEDYKDGTALQYYGSLWKTQARYWVDCIKSKRMVPEKKRLQGSGVS